MKTITCLWLIASSAGSLHAATLFSWETGTESWNASATAGITTSAIGATHGSNSLAITTPMTDMWYATPASFDPDAAQREAIFNGATTLTIDVSYPNPGYTDWFGNASVEMIVQGDGVAWTGLGVHEVVVDAAPETFSWTLPDGVAGALATGTWAQLVLKFTYGNGGSTSTDATFYVDNFTSDAMAVPEASSGIAILGAFALIACRRRR